MKNLIIYCVSALFIPCFFSFHSISDEIKLEELNKAIDPTTGNNLYSYQGELYSGESYRVFKISNIKRTFSFENGLMTKEVGYHSNGVLESSVQYVNGKRNGKLVGYFEDGTTKYIEANYINGVLDGMQYGWNFDGSLRYQEHRLNGQVISRFDFEVKGEWPVVMDGC